MSKKTDQIVDDQNSAEAKVQVQAAAEVQDLEQAIAEVQDPEQVDADPKAMEQATAAATKQQFTREQLESMGLDPAPYGFTK